MSVVAEVRNNAQPDECRRRRSKRPRRRLFWCKKRVFPDLELHHTRGPVKGERRTSGARFPWVKVPKARRRWIGGSFHPGSCSLRIMIHNLWNIIAISASADPLKLVGGHPLSRGAVDTFSRWANRANFYLVYAPREESLCEKASLDSQFLNLCSIFEPAEYGLRKCHPTLGLIVSKRSRCERIG